MAEVAERTDEQPDDEDHGLSVVGGAGDTEKKKAITVRWINREECETTREAKLYEVLDKLIEKHHPHLADADIALCWKSGWRANSDGVVHVTQLKKGNEVDQALRRSGVDAVILLNREILESSKCTVALTKYFLDHALESMKPKCDQSGDQIVDEDDAPVWRTRKPTIQLFPEVYARHGCVVEELAGLRKIFFDREKKDQPLFDALMKDDA